MAESPDILWLSLESVRASNTPMYGYERETTPYLQEFCEQSNATVLHNGIAQSLWTPASSASMLTGTHLSTHQVGQDGVENQLPRTINTLPELLREAGYTTSLVTPNPYLSDVTGLDRGFKNIKVVQAVPDSYSPLHPDAIDYWKEGLRRSARSKILSPSRLKNELKTTENELVERYSKNQLSSMDKGKSPFFLYAHIPGAHHPYLPNQDYLRSYTDDISLSAEEAFSLVKEIYYGGITKLKQRIANGLDFSTEEWAAIEAMYDATLRHMDHTAGQLIQYAKDISDNLIIVVAGDHGELFGEYGLLGHNVALHDEVIKVPMIVSGISDVQTSPLTFTQHIDLTYTIADIAGVLTDQFEGRDIRTEGRTYAFSQRGQANLDRYRAYNGNFDTSLFFENPYTCVRTDGWKLAVNEDDTFLFELPKETNDVSDENPNKMAELRTIFNEEDIQWSDPSSRDESKFDESQMSQLRDLGYLS